LRSCLPGNSCRMDFPPPENEASESARADLPDAAAIPPGAGPGQLTVPILALTFIGEKAMDSAMRRRGTRAGTMVLPGDPVLILEELSIMGRLLKFVIMFFVCCSLVATAYAAKGPDGSTPKKSKSAEPQTDQPSMEVPETTYDFGEVPEGTEVEHDFFVKNMGKGALQIEQVRPSCGCTVASFDQTIRPGGEGRIHLKLHLKGFQGSVKKTATVFTNDPKESRAVLVLQGTIKAIVEIRPSANVSFRGMTEQLTENTIDLKAGSQSFHIQKLESNLEDKVSYRLETVEDGKHYRLIIANRLKQGAYAGFVKCLTDIPQKPEILIRVNGFIEGDIAVRPTTVLVGKLAAEQPVRMGKVLVAGNHKKPFKIQQLIYDEKLLRIEQQPQENGTAINLEITPLLDNVPNGGREQTMLSIVTDAAPDEKYEVQVHVLRASEAAGQATPPPGVKEGESETRETKGAAQ